MSGWFNIGALKETLSRQVTLRREVPSKTAGHIPRHYGAVLSIATKLGPYKRLSK